MVVCQIMYFALYFFTDSHMKIVFCNSSWMLPLSMKTVFLSTPDLLPHTTLHDHVDNDELLHQLSDDNSRL